MSEIQGSTWNFNEWGERHYFDKGECQYRLVDRETKKVIPVVAVRAADGRLRPPEELENVRKSGL